MKDIEFEIDCVSGKTDYISGESNTNYMNLNISERGSETSVDLDKDKCRELIKYLTEFVEQPEPVKKVEGWVNKYPDGWVSKIYSSEVLAREGCDSSDATQVQIKEV